MTIIVLRCQMLMIPSWRRGGMYDAQLPGGREERILNYKGSSLLLLSRTNTPAIIIIHMLHIYIKKGWKWSPKNIPPCSLLVPDQQKSQGINQ